MCWVELLDGYIAILGLRRWLLYAKHKLDQKLGSV